MQSIATLATLPAPEPIPVVEEQITAQSSDTLSMAKRLTIEDQVTYDLAADSLKGVVALRKEIEGKFSESKKTAFQAHKAITALETETLKPVKEAEALLKGKMGAFVIEQERLQRQAQARAEAEARKREEEERLQTALEASADGATEAEVETILATEAPLVVPVAAPVYARARGISTPMLYSAELENFEALVKAAAANPALLVYLQPNMVTANASARAQKEAFSIPGFKLKKTPNVSVRG